MDYQGLLHWIQVITIIGIKNMGMLKTVKVNLMVMDKVKVEEDVIVEINYSFMINLYIFFIWIIRKYIQIYTNIKISFLYHNALF